MTILLTALLVAILFTTGTYLLLRREPIKLILGLNLITYGVNILLFSTSTLRQGIPPIIADKDSFAGDIAEFVDPVPQALILTAIVISFGMTAFLVVLVNRRHSLISRAERASHSEVNEVANDPFSATTHYLTGLDADPDDYEWLEMRFPLSRPSAEGRGS